MTPEEMNTAIYHKMEAEQDSYRDCIEDRADKLLQPEKEVR